MPIPEDTKFYIDRYVNEHYPVGHFLTAVLSNDLVGAFSRADDHNLRAMMDIVSYCYNDIPSTCWGNPEKVKKWLEHSEA